MRFLLASAIVMQLLTTSLLAVQEANSPAASVEERAIAGRIEPLVRQLNDERAATRDAAEKQLLELAGATAVEADRFLKALPQVNDEMPGALRDRVMRIRNQIEDRAAKSAIERTTITLSDERRPLAAVFDLIERQTGNRLRDKREQLGAGGGELLVAGNFKDEPFWSAIDQLLDEANLSIYNYAGADGLSIVGRSEEDGPRFGEAAYSGPFRMEILEVQGQRNTRQPNRKAMKLQLEVAWEPRLRPIAVTQPAAGITATDDTGSPIPVAEPDAVYDIDVTSGTQATEIVIPFQLPAREVKQIATLKGKLNVLVPGRQVKFQFADLSKANGKVQRTGGVQVTLEKAHKNNAIWEVDMKFELDDANRALESHRGWVFQNLSYLVDGEGNRVEHVGFETTTQTPNAVGMAYLFDLPEGKTLEGFSWVYETPAAIVEVPVEYELKKIDLP